MVLLIIPLLVMLAVLFAFVGVQRWMRQQGEVERRLVASFGDDIELRRRNLLTDQVNQTLGHSSMMARLERQLAAADIKMKAAEFLVIRVGLTLILLLVGWLISGYLLGGLLLAGFGWLAPGMVLKHYQTKRSRDFANQLPDMLNLLVGSLRAGYGLLHACNVVKSEMPDPIAAEFDRLIKEVSLGFNITSALGHMVERLNDEDLALIVTSIQVQNEVGGSLADVLETISVTIRERIKLKGQIRVMTSQQRATGWVLTGLPFATGTFMMMINPDYMMGMFQPGFTLFIPIGALVMVILGNIAMRWAMKIDY